MKRPASGALGLAVALLALRPGLALAADNLPSRSALVGDWQGRAGGLVAQVYVAEGGKYQANVLKRFDAPDNLVAVLSGETADESVVFRGQGWSAKIEGNRFKGTKERDQFDLRPLRRLSPTLGAKPPPGATVLFNGANLDQWARQKPKQWVEADGPADQWKLVEERALEVVPGTGSIITKKQFGDFTLHLEFRTLGGPLNSGVYLQCRYEVNLKDSYGQTTGTPCAAPGNVTPPEATPPIPNAAAPPLQWQTLDVDFRAPRFAADGKEKQQDARFTVALNGVKLYENLEATTIKGAAKRLGEAPTGPLMLQEHGSPIQFRNIWIVEKGS